MVPSGSLAVPDRITIVPAATDWSGPVSTTGGWLEDGRVSRHDGRLSAFWNIAQGIRRRDVAVRVGWLGEYVRNALLARAQLGQAKCLLKGQQGIRRGDASVPIHVAVGQAGGLGV